MIPPTQRFSDRVKQYVRGRPNYPAELLRFFEDAYHLRHKDPVGDIGSGTGLLTELFVRNGNPTFAVEPNAPMRTAAEASLGRWPNFHSVTGTAEATTLAEASVQFVTAGQAFHWFNWQLAQREFRRILKPHGVIALIWNERLSDASEFMSDYEKLMQQYKKPAEATREKLSTAKGEETIARFFAAAGCRHQVHLISNPQPLDRNGLIDRVVSSSTMPLQGEEGYEPMLESIHALFDRHGRDGVVRILHETHVYHARIGG